MRNYIVCAFYTENYASEVAALESSVRRFGIEFHKERYDSRGYWEANTRIKPEFLLKSLSIFPTKDVLYLDADSLLRAEPVFFDSFGGDVGVYKAIGDGFTHKYLTGTLYLKNSPTVINFLHEWIGRQGGRPTDVDQDGFERAVAACSDLRVIPLPAGYTKIFDRDDMLGEVVVEHFQASRKRVKLSRLLKRIRNTMIGAVILGIAGAVVFL